MTIYPNMLSLFMEHKIISNMKGSLVITTEFVGTGVSMSTSLKS